MSLPTPPPVEAYIALGSNLGDSRSLIQDAFRQLQQFSDAPIRCSSLWRSAPVDCPPGSPDFINAAAAIVPLPGETPETLIAKLQSLELAFGRQAKVVMNEPRPLDLDLIAFGQEVRKTPQLMVPHPRACQRAFVLLPLSEIAADVTLAGEFVTIGKLASLLPRSEVVVRI